MITVYGKDGENGTKQEIQQTAGERAPSTCSSPRPLGTLDGNGPGGPDIVKYQLDLGMAANLLLVGQNVPYSHRIGAYDASSGVKAPGFPVITDDYQFLSSSTIANVTGGAGNQVLAGTGLGLLHAYDGVTGQDAPGFPKVTGGWLFAPAALSDDKRMSAITREGYLFEWKAADLPSCQSQWPSFRHDQQGTGNYDSDGTPPAAPGRMSLTELGTDRYRVSFRSPGDDGSCGTANRYVADANGQALDLGSPVAAGGQVTKDFTLSGAGLRATGPVTVTVRAADGPSGQAFNLGAPGVVALGAAGGGGKVTSRCIPRKVRSQRPAHRPGAHRREPERAQAPLPRAAEHQAHRALLRARRRTLRGGRAAQQDLPRGQHRSRAQDPPDRPGPPAEARPDHGRAPGRARPVRRAPRGRRTRDLRHAPRTDPLPRGGQAQPDGAPADARSAACAGWASARAPRGRTPGRCRACA